MCWKKSGSNLKQKMTVKGKLQVLTSCILIIHNTNQNELSTLTKIRISWNLIFKAFVHVCLYVLTDAIKLVKNSYTIKPICDVLCKCIFAENFKSNLIFLKISEFTYSYTYVKLYWNFFSGRFLILAMVFFSNILCASWSECP